MNRVIMKRITKLVCAIALGLGAGVCAWAQAGATTGSGEGKPMTVIQPEVLARAESSLVAKYGEPQRERARLGVKQVSEFWRAEDGDAKAFEQFVAENFAGDQKALDVMFNRYEHLLEQLDGHMQEIAREFRTQSDLDRGPIEPYDDMFGSYDPSDHVGDDMFRNKLAFVVLLNFPLTTLEERLTQGPNWTRRQWAEARLADRFSKRVPAEVNAAISEAASESSRYIAEYNIWMHHLVDAKGERLFPARMKLLSHWNLRDEIKGDYADAQNGIAKQRTVQQVFERIVTQTIPKEVINNPTVDWNPFTNEVKPAAVKDWDGDAKVPAKASNAPEPDTRYATLLSTYKAVRRVDPYSPTAPTFIARRFDEGREIPEARVKAMLEQVLTSPLVPRVAKLIEKRLGRPLEPFDVWYNGFRARGKYSDAELDRIVAQRYPTPQAYEKDIPNMLVKLGFTPEKAAQIAANIVVDPARGSGHAMGASMRTAPAHLRTRVGTGGMDYKGYNIAVHEMGHNVEQTISLNTIDHYLIHGVPNTAFTEALAFVFQARDLQLLGLKSDDPQGEALTTLNDFWGTYEIAGVALVDMGVWHWMYDHPDATPAELKQATLSIAREVWNKYYAPVFGKRDVVLLAVYSHMIDSFLYLPDYPIGHLIAHQIEEQIRKSGTVGPEFERMAREGCVVPDVWMKNATGLAVGPEAMLAATGRALKQFGD